MPLERSDRIDIPVLPLRDVVVYPHMVIPLFVGREKSISALEDVIKKISNYINNLSSLNECLFNTRINN